MSKEQQEIIDRKKNLDIKRAIDRESMDQVINQLKQREDKNLSKDMELNNIQNELKQVKKMKAGYLLEDKQKQLKDLENKKKEVEDERFKLARELNHLDNDMLYNVENDTKKMQQRVNNSEYLNNPNNPKNKHLQMIKEAAENNARFKYKQEIFNAHQNNMSYRSRIENATRHENSYEPARANLLNVGNDILNSSVNDVYGNNQQQIKNSQDRINKLIKDRQKTINQMNNDQTLDEIDMLKLEVDNGYKSDGNIYRSAIMDYANEIRTERELNPKEKADRMTNIRRGLSRKSIKTDTQRINYQAAKPILDKRLIQLNQIIKTQRANEIKNERLRLSQNMNAGIPKYKNKHEKSALNDIRTERTDFRKPLIANYKNVSS